MNEGIFILHLSIVLACLLIALRMGKEALVAMICLGTVLANLFVVKQMRLFGFSITCSDVFAIGSILGLNLLQEYFGKDVATKAVKISFIGLVFFAVVSQVHLAYVPHAEDVTQGAFQTILSSQPRILAASIGVFYIVQKFDVFFFGWLKRLFNGEKLPVRMAISLFFSQFLDTVLFSFFGLYGLVVSIFDVVLISFLAKCIVIFCSSPFTLLSKRVVKRDV